ncbi:helix-turn-helix transcriptional regulator [uncultured Faecalibaculum sp.]|uniref:helix-turn-helix transcriptional regulator n=1 Tax=uncultured Faecalibaculum sp. TaxID=1729681 RepID=UPI0025E9B411|nr:helix-turn-helix transcriptional regulator [uncultured Faecalibaculum sp.]
MDPQEIGTALRELRGMKTVKTVAHALGVTESAVTNWENGIRVPRDELKKRIADYYGVKAGEIFFDE